MACPPAATADGFEMQFGTNHLGHFVFVNQLAPLLIAGAPSRVVVLSSAGHQFSDVDLDDPNFEHTEYDPWAAYGRAKTANVLFAVALDRRLRERGVRACAVHPGGVGTELGRHLTREAIASMIARRADAPVARMKSVPAGAATQVWAAIVADPDEIGGHYCEDCGIAPRTEGSNVRSGVFDYALDAGRAEALWALSEKLVGERFPLS